MKPSKQLSAALLAVFVFGFAMVPFNFAAAQAAYGVDGAPAAGGVNGAPAAYGVNGSSAGATLPNPLKGVTSISDLLYLIANIATYIGAILAVLALIWVGFKFVAAQGNPEKISEAKHNFLAIVIGIAILIGASAIISIIKNTLTSAGVVQSSTFTSPN